MVLPFLEDRPPKEPFALNPGEKAAKALVPGIAEVQIAWRFNPLNLGDLNEFIERWATWFADASQGRLQHPSTIPEHSPDGSWRR